MADLIDVDGLLIQWGDRLFYPGNRTIKDRKMPRWRGLSVRSRAANLRARIGATVLRRAPQVMVKVTGGGRGMKAIAAHFRYISKNGRLGLEDELGNVDTGKAAVREMAEDWRFGGSLIEEEGRRREALNIMLSMPAGTDPLAVQRAAREFAQAELTDHKYVMVLHDHQANPHVHISVRVESKHGKRIDPRKSDLHRWRETFAEALRGWGIDAEATRQATRGARRNYGALWQARAADRGDLRNPLRRFKTGAAVEATRYQALKAWSEVGRALAASADMKDRELAAGIDAFLRQGRGSPEKVNPVRGNAQEVQARRGANIKNDLGRGR